MTADADIIRSDDKGYAEACLMYFVLINMFRREPEPLAQAPVMLEFIDYSGVVGTKLESGA